MHANNSILLARFRTVVRFMQFVAVCVLTIVVGRFMVSISSQQGADLANTATNTHSQASSHIPASVLPLTVDSLRSREIVPSEIIIESQEYVGTNYTAYRASFEVEGLTEYGLLTKPDGEEPQGGFRAILFLHGYIPPDQYRTAQRYEAYVDAFARSGFVVFKIDYRGHDQSEGRPGGAYFSSDYVVDALTAYESLQDLSYVAPDGIGVWGHSMSGNVGLRTLAARPDIPAVVLWAGAGYTYSDLLDLGITDSSYQRTPEREAQEATRPASARTLIRESGVADTILQSLSPAAFASDFTGALQLHHAVDDDVVSIEYQRSLVPVLEQAGAQFEAFEYPTGGHNISGGSFNLAMSRSIAFFEEYLGG